MNKPSIHYDRFDNVYVCRERMYHNLRAKQQAIGRGRSMEEAYLQMLYHRIWLNDKEIAQKAEIVRCVTLIKNLESELKVGNTPNNAKYPFPIGYDPKMDEYSIPQDKKPWYKFWR